MLLLVAKVTKTAGGAIPPRPQTRNMYHITLQTAALPLTSVRNAHEYYMYAGIYISIIRRGVTPSPFHLSSVGDDAHIVPFCCPPNSNFPTHLVIYRHSNIIKTDKNSPLFIQWGIMLFMQLFQQCAQQTTHKCVCCLAANIADGIVVCSCQSFFCN